MLSRFTDLQMKLTMSTIFDVAGVAVVVVVIVVVTIVAVVVTLVAVVVTLAVVVVTLVVNEFGDVDILGVVILGVVVVGVFRVSKKLSSGAFSLQQ